jgi:hypothetical protein
LRWQQLIDWATNGPPKVFWIRVRVRVRVRARARARARVRARVRASGPPKVFWIADPYPHPQP